MPMLHSVLLGLVAVLVFDVFDVHADDSVIYLSMHGKSGNLHTLACNPGYVAIACGCSGNCKAVFQPIQKLSKCRAHSEDDTEVAVTATCIKDDVSKYYQAVNKCKGQDKIVACNIKNTNRVRFLTQKTIEDGVCVTKTCDECVRQVVCKKA